MIWLLVALVLFMARAQGMSGDAGNLCNHPQAKLTNFFIETCGAEAVNSVVAAAASGGGGGNGGGGSCTCDCTSCPPPPGSNYTIEDSICPTSLPMRADGHSLYWVDDGNGGGCYQSLDAEALMDAWGQQNTCEKKQHFTPLWLNGGSNINDVLFATYQVCGDIVSLEMSVNITIFSTFPTIAIMRLPTGLGMNAGPVPPTIADSSITSEISIASGLGMNQLNGNYLEAKVVLLLESQCLASGAAIQGADRVKLVAQDSGVTNHPIVLNIDGAYQITTATCL